MDKEALKQQEILYTQDFQLQQLEHRMARLQGERSDDEKVQLQTKIKVRPFVLIILGKWKHVIFNSGTGIQYNTMNFYGITLSLT